ncbi:hypothetical protein BSQ44_26005 (plasmid) [Aquibium oceanicum]|uniref:Uncharacterized protein n=1 Tax=Aquibium oceanicum TaxID=1670800 RepID=A0A1L3SZY3_9HYPH|nr:hypothetical protein [Aquibium oceanicum]APH74940.1 hypothetical protein BSQ44_26005 [Aquibium oceanicum]
MNQSALLPLGLEASEAYTLLMIMTVGGGLILAGVMAFAALAIFGNDRVRTPLSREGLIIIGGWYFLWSSLLRCSLPASA